MSVTQFCADTVNMRPMEHPAPKKNQSLYGEDDHCFLCGGDTKGRGFHKKQAINKSSLMPGAEDMPLSSTVCEPCAAFFKREPFLQCVEDFGLDVKTKSPLSWQHYSHVFYHGGHACPNRAAWREWLLEPPKPPFVFAMAVSGKKHLIYKSKISDSRDNYYVQLEEQSFLIDREKFREILEVFEEGYELGLSKASLESGNYNQKAVMKIGFSKWREIEDRISTYRQSAPDYLSLCAFCAQKPEESK